MRAGSAPPSLSKAPRLRKARLLPIACAFVLVSFAAHADYKQDYARALKAYRDGNYAEAQPLFAAAAAEHPEPAEKTKLYGMLFEPYVPQHYLGLIAARAGDCGRARAQWNAAGNADVVAKLGEAAVEERSASAKCGDAVAQNKPAPAPVTPVAQAPAPPVASVQQKPPPSTTSEPVRPVVVAPPVVAVNKSSEPANKLAPQETPVERPVADKVAPPDQLVMAFESFLSGRLAEVSRINPDAYADARARFHAYLVRSGARYTLGQLNGDQSLLDSARADARAAKNLNPGAAPDAVLFSPRFLAFYRETR